MLEQLGMIGISWRQGGTESLAGFTLDDAAVDERLEQFARRLELNEIAYIATCNRVELVFVRSAVTPGNDLRAAAFELLTGRDPAAGEAERTLRAWQGEGAAEHLFLVAAGLDSACIGETEIVGQVRAAQQRAARCGLLGATLDLVFEEALKIAARVRGRTRLGTGRVSLAEIAVELIAERLERTPGRVALVGVSPMTERAAVSLHAARTPLVVVNRSADKAARLASRFEAEHRTLDDFARDPAPIEALLSATGAPSSVLDAPALERIAASTPSGEAPLVVDMAVPADVDPDTAARFDIPRVGMDAIVERAEHNRASRLVEAAQAREQVDDALAALTERVAERFYGPLFGALQQRYRHTAEEGMRRLLDRELADLDAEQRAAIETWTRVLARRFAHIPCLGLRGLLHEGPEGSIEAFLSGLEPEFADELRAALESPAAREPRKAQAR